MTLDAQPPGHFEPTIDNVPDPTFDVPDSEVQQEFNEAQSMAEWSSDNLPEGTQLSEGPDLQTRSYEPRELAREIAKEEHGTTTNDGQWEHHVTALNDEIPGAERSRELLDEAGVSLHSPENIVSLPDTRDDGFGFEPTEGATLHNEIHSSEFRDSFANQIADRLEAVDPDHRADELAAINVDMHEGRITPISSERIAEESPVIPPAEISEPPLASEPESESSPQG
jgi:hypothetical protein